MCYNKNGDKMKVIIVSDIHGASEKLKIVMDFMKEEQIDKMIILGDIFNNYYELSVSSKEISQMMWSIPDKLTVVRGNCDSSYDETLIPVGMLDYYETIINGIRCYFHHGHLRTNYNSSIKLYASGHTHVARLEKIDNIIYLNPGSIGRPRDYSIGSFAVISTTAITIFDLSLKVINEIKL